MKLCGAIFDLDGTLLDSMGMWKNIASLYIESLGVIPEDNLDKKLLSMSMGQAIAYCIDNYSIGGTVPQHIRHITKMIASFYATQAQLKPGVVELLDSFKCENIKMCVATATDRRLIEPALKRCEIYEYFSEIFTCSSVGKSKSEPRIYDISLSHLGTSKETTVVFEDALHAAITAKKAGYKVVGVFDVNEREHKKVQELCDLYARSLSEITPRLLEEKL